MHVHGELHVSISAWWEAPGRMPDVRTDPGGHGVPLLLRYAFDLSCVVDMSTNLKD